MCDPVSMTALALTAAGTGASAIGAGQVKSAQKKATRAENTRQTDIRGKSYGDVNDTLSGVSRPTQDALASAATAKRGAAYTAPIGAPQFMSPLGPSNSAIGGEYARAGGVQQAKSLSEALARAKLDAYGDAATTTNFRTAHNAQDIGFNSRQAQESSNILPLELQDANRKGAGMKTLGDVLTAAGSIASMGGAAGLGGLFSRAAPVTFGSDFGSKLFTSASAFA